MTRKERYSFVLDWFLTHLPNPETELHYNSPFELLVAVVLSAQCTDKRVNIVTPALFKKYPTPKTLAAASFDEIKELIQSVTFANNKTKHLMGLAEMLVRDFDGEIPETVVELEQLPGVGRKTANVITSVLHQQPNMAVDTHVFRVSARIGLTLHAKNPMQAEEQLISYIPKELVYKAHHWLILHGRYICIARRPKCEICGLRSACKFYHTDMRHLIKEELDPLTPEEVKRMVSP
ncbi:MAG: endonuclease III [Bacteroidetes bacterium]|nr:endonuclease III [Bacteroidota bacterium]MBS1740944.1 endonuclease III [Bacteroidota bacterium]MBS1775044.1 endonuclease III [Bacteroidota bacterium]